MCSYQSYENCKTCVTKCEDRILSKEDEEKYYPCSGDCETECSGRQICPLICDNSIGPDG